MFSLDLSATMSARGLHRQQAAQLKSRAAILISSNGGGRARVGGRGPVTVMAAKRVVIGEVQYPSKKEAKLGIRNLLRELEGKVVKPDDRRFPVLLALFERHPRHLQKVEQPPVQAFTVVKNADRPMYLELQFKDGRGVFEAISVDKCIRQQDDSPNEMLEEAMRQAIYPQVHEFRDRQAPSCVKCGSTNRLQSDHVEPFKSLVEGFKQSYGKLPELCYGEAPRTNRVIFAVDHLPTQQVSLLWQQYHQEHAVLQVLCKCCHDKKSAIQRTARAADGRSTAAERKAAEGAHKK